MTLIPALLQLSKPKIHSIDSKGRATISIRLLSNRWMHSPMAFTKTKCYRTRKEDLLIMVHQKDKESRMFKMDHIVGEANCLDHWCTILPYRVGIVKYSHIPLRPFRTLSESPEGMSMSTVHRKFLLVDSPGTVDREDGIWFDSNEDFGVFVVDIPTQFGWTNNRKPCHQILSEQWLNSRKTQQPPTCSFYLPRKRLSMLDPKTYHCITPETLRKYTSIPIICYHWKKKSVFKSTIHVSHDVTCLDSETSPYPKWFNECPTLKDTKVCEWNATMNAHWFHMYPTHFPFMISHL